MTLSKIIFGSFILLAMACNGSKKMAEEETKKMEMQDENKNMLAAGFLSGTMMYSDKEGDCAYTIKVNDGTDRLLDPINLEELNKNFMKDGEKVWFKFQGLRMMNRCPKANPINLQEIKKRAE